MGRILNSFVSTLPESQAKSIRERLARKVGRGEIRTGDEYRAAREEAFRAFLGSRAERVFSGHTVRHGERISSFEINESMAEMASDIEMLFKEIDLLLTEAEAQRERNKLQIESRISLALSGLEGEIEKISFLHKNPSGLHSGITENFKAGSNRLSRAAPEAALVYRDPKTREVIPREEEMIPEPINGGLMLSIERSLAILPSITDQEEENPGENNREAAPIHGQPSTPTEHPPLARGFSLSDVTDNKIGTYWFKDVYREISPGSDPGEAYLNLRLDLGGDKLIDYVQIEPAFVDAQEISAIYLTDEEMTSTEITFTPFEIKEPIRIYLKRHKARELILIFTQRGYRLSQVFDGYYHFEFGFDNIITGEATYRKKGFYASRTVLGNNLSLFRLFATENKSRGALNAADMNQHTHETDSSIINGRLPPVEYYLLYRDLDSSGNLLFSRTIPMLKSGQERVQEYLEISIDKSTFLNFHVRPSLTVDDADDYTDFNTLRIYRNGVLLKRGSNQIPGDYKIENHFGDGQPLFERKTKIQLTETVSEDAEFMADYIPFSTLTPDPIYGDESGLIRHGNDGSVEIERPSASRAVRSEANLIIMVRNGGDQTASPTINEYKLGFREKNED